MLAMPAQGSLDVPNDLTSTKALSLLLPQVHASLSNEYTVVCLAVDTLRLGSQEGVDSVSQPYTTTTS